MKCSNPNKMGEKRRVHPTLELKRKEGETMKGLTVKGFFSGMVMELEIRRELGHRREGSNIRKRGV